jgi:glycosyltransferase involved in cell wall biosynthesis
MRIERARPRGDITSVVSVVVPCYIYGQFLPEAVGSVLNQGALVEIIIVDDCSTDDGAELADRRPTVRPIRIEHDLGHITTYNEGSAW